MALSRIIWELQKGTSSAHRWRTWPCSAEGEVSSCFARPETGRTSNRLVTDGDGRIFEAQLYSEGGVLDIVLDEVAPADFIGSELSESSGTLLESLSEEELRTVRHPERRYLTVTYTQLQGLTQLADRLRADGGEIDLWIPLLKKRVTQCARQDVPWGRRRETPFSESMERPAITLTILCERSSRPAIRSRRRRNSTPDFTAKEKSCLPAHAGSGRATHWWACWELRFGSATPLSAPQSILRRGSASWRAPERRCFPSTR